MKANKSTFFGWFICTLGALFYCYEYFLRIAPSVMTTELMRAYSIGAGSLGNLTAFYYYAYTPMQLPVGLLLDRYSPRILLFFACLVCAMGSYMFAGTHHYWIAAPGRFLVGFGSAFAFVGVLKLATVWLPPNRFALVAGLASSLGMVGAMIGDISLTKLVADLGWETTLMHAATLGVVLAIIMLIVLRDKLPENTKEHPHIKEIMLGMLRLLRHRELWLLGIIGSLLFLSLSVFAELWGIIYLERVYQFTSVKAATAVSMVFLGWAIGGPLFGYISDATGKRILPLTVGSFGAAFFSLILLLNTEMNTTMIFIVLIAMGIFASAEVLVFALAVDLCPATISGSVLAIINMLIMLGGVLFQPIVGMLLDYTWQGELIRGHRLYTLMNFQIALSVLPIGFIIAGFMSLSLKDKVKE